MVDLKKMFLHFALETKSKNKTLIESLQKVNIFNKKENGSSLLDESNLKE
jgi:hypothetical protein